MNGYQIGAIICFILAFISLLIVPVYHYEYEYQEGPGYQEETEESEIIWLGVLWNVFIWLLAIGLAIKGHQVSKESSTSRSPSTSSSTTSSVGSEGADGYGFKAEQGRGSGSSTSSSPSPDRITSVDDEMDRSGRTDLYEQAKLVLPGGKTKSISRQHQWFGREDFMSIVPRQDFDYVSRDHFKITQESGRYYIEDQNSTNGTTLNGVDITGQGKREIHDGDKICVAD
ncbi:MAG: FHA domain-containing protein, partial [Candidatus Saliniplasma sp.]